MLSFKLVTGLMDTYVCTQCVQIERITDVSQLRVGDHISAHGQFSHCKCRKFCWCVYKHHMIVSGIEEELKVISVIGFEECNTEQEMLNCRKGLRLLEKQIDIDLVENHCNRILYRGVTDDMVRMRVDTARQYLQDGNQVPYNLLCYNCEHFCYDVCAKQSVSGQIDCYKTLFWHILNVIDFFCALFAFTFLKNRASTTILTFLYCVTVLVPFTVYKFLKKIKIKCKHCKGHVIKELLLGGFVLLSSGILCEKITHYYSNDPVEIIVWCSIFSCVTVIIVTVVVPWITKRPWSLLNRKKLLWLHR